MDSIVEALFLRIESRELQLRFEAFKVFNHA